jgi:phosphohistidine phosphatase SixA
MQLEMLYIARHAPAEEFHPAHPGQDAPRRLTASGERLATTVFNALHERGFTPEHIYTSPFARTFRTAELAREAFHLRQPVESVAGLAPAGNRDDVRALLLNSPYRTAMMVGHEPAVSQWVSELCSRSGSIAQYFERAGVTLVRVYELGGHLRGELVFHAPPSLFAGADELEPDGP